LNFSQKISTCFKAPVGVARSWI